MQFPQFPNKPRLHDMFPNWVKIQRDNVVACGKYHYSSTAPQNKFVKKSSSPIFTSNMLLIVFTYKVQFAAKKTGLVFRNVQHLNTANYLHA